MLILHLKWKVHFAENKVIAISFEQERNKYQTLLRDSLPESDISIFLWHIETKKHRVKLHKIVSEMLSCLSIKIVARYSYHFWILYSE